MLFRSVIGAGALIGGGLGYLANKYMFNTDMEGNPIELSSEQQRQREVIRAGGAFVQDAVAPGGSIITTPQGGRMITSNQDSVIAAKDGGELGKKLDLLIAAVRENRDFYMDGKKVSDVIKTANLRNPFTA